MKWWALATIFTAAFATALGGTLPMSIVFDRFGSATGVSAAEISGSIWSSQMRQAHYRGMSLGDLEASLDPGILFGGSRRLAVKSALGRFTLVDGTTRGIEAADLRIPIPKVSNASSLTGELRLERATLLFVAKRCTRAEGRLMTDVVQRAFNGPVLEGEVSCAGAAAIAELAGRAMETTVHTELRMTSDGRYQVETQVTSSDPVVRAALVLAGFVENPNGFVRSDEGALGS